MGLMKAVTFDAPGDPSVLKLTTVEAPQMKPHELRIK